MLDVAVSFGNMCHVWGHAILCSDLYDNSRHIIVTFDDFRQFSPGDALFNPRRRDLFKLGDVIFRPAPRFSFLSDAVFRPPATPFLTFFDLRRRSFQRFSTSGNALFRPAKRFFDPRRRSFRPPATLSSTFFDPRRRSFSQFSIPGYAPFRLPVSHSCFVFLFRVQWQFSS